MELRLCLAWRAFVPARPEVEDRVGVNVVNARVPLLAEVGLSVWARRRGIEVLLEPFYVASAPGAGEAVGAESAPLRVVGVVGGVPVADVDHVQQAWLAASEALAYRGLQEQSKRATLQQLGRDVARGGLNAVLVAVSLGDEQLPDRFVLQKD